MHADRKLTIAMAVVRERGIERIAPPLMMAA
jgi:hypothetical protein